MKFQTQWIRLSLFTVAIAAGALSIPSFAWAEERASNREHENKANEARRREQSRRQEEERRRREIEYRRRAVEVRRRQLDVGIKNLEARVKRAKDAKYELDNSIPSLERELAEIQASVSTFREEYEAAGDALKEARRSGKALQDKLERYAPDGSPLATTKQTYEENKAAYEQVRAEVEKSDDYKRLSDALEKKQYMDGHPRLVVVHARMTNARKAYDAQYDAAKREHPDWQASLDAVSSARDAQQTKRGEFGQASKRLSELKKNLESKKQTAALAKVFLSQAPNQIKRMQREREQVQRLARELGNNGRDRHRNNRNSNYRRRDGRR
jgi:DNA repair exonuclease SbcCD ATPase subunit